MSIINDNDKFILVLGKRQFDEVNGIMAKHKSQHYLVYMSDALIHVHNDENMGPLAKTIKCRYFGSGETRRVGVSADSRGDVVVPIHIPSRPVQTKSSLTTKWIQV